MYLSRLPLPLLLVLSACDPSDPAGREEGVGDPFDDAADTGVDTAAPGASAYVETVYRPFLEESCGGCHRASGHIGPAITEDPTSLFAASSVEDLPYVTPGSLEQSFLWYKVNDRQDERGDEGTRMPPPPGASLSDEARAAIDAWILGGAEE